MFEAFCFFIGYAAYRLLKLVLTALVAFFVLASICLAVAHAAIPTCSWDKPGHRPFTGSVPGAVDTYKDIPVEIRTKLKARMERRQYDEIATITRDTITGKDYQYTDLRQMHFGAGKVCTTVSRGKWSDTHKERGLVYCEGSYCLIVPTVCRNVSRVTWVEPPPTGAGPPAPPAPAEDAPPSSATAPPSDFLAPPAPEPTFNNPNPPAVHLPPPAYMNPPTYIPPVLVANPVPEPEALLLGSLGLLIVCVYARGVKP